METRRSWGIGLFLVLVAIHIPDAHAFLEIGSDVFVSGVVGIGTEVHLRTRNYIYLGGGSFHFGPVVRVELQHSYLQDYSYGAGLKLGKRFFFECEGALMRRQFEGAMGNGYLLGILIGWQFTKVFRIAFPVTVKRTELGSDNRWTLDYLPYIGLKVGF